MKELAQMRARKKVVSLLLCSCVHPYSVIVVTFLIAHNAGTCNATAKDVFRRGNKNHAFHMSNDANNMFSLNYVLQQQKAEQLAAKLQKYDLCIR